MSTAFELTSNRLGQVVLKRPDADDVVDVRLRRCFPWTLPGEFVSIRSSDGKEVMLIERVSDLPATQREQVERFLEDTSFIPTIRTVQSINMDFGYQVWTVDTDRGPSTFRVQEREDVRFLPDGRFSVKDVEGNVYVMPRLDTMDPQTQRVMSVIV